MWAATGLEATIERRFLRAASILSGLAGVALTVAFLMQTDWATNLWPWLSDGYNDPSLSFIFLASITLAVGVPTLWIGITGEVGVAVGGAINLLLTFGGVGVFLFNEYQQNQDDFAATARIVCAVAVFMLAATGVVALRHPIRDRRPMPLPVRISFALFVVILLIVGGLLLTDTQDVYPWWISPETATLYGWIYIGAASYFAYGVLVPRWANASGQLLGFLAYDLILLPPFLGHFAVVEPERRASLTVYTVVLVYSALLACYYLFIHRPTRLWFNAATQPPGASAV